MAEKFSSNYGSFMADPLILDLGQGLSDASEFYFWVRGVR